MNADDYGPGWLPATGPVQAPRCDRCGVTCSLVVEHRKVWGWGPEAEVPVKPRQLTQGCPDCGGYELRHGTRLLARTDPPASLAGVMAKLSATEVPWATCTRCQYGARVVLWPWVRCTTPGCGRESQGTYR